ncbi:MAG: hypothetical protein WDM78_08990 [Puia sp.]
MDPYLIGAGGTTEWQSLQIYHDYFIMKYLRDDKRGKDHYGSNEAHKLSSLISFPYFKKSVDFLFAGSTKEYYDIGKDRPRKYGRFSDGTICYPYSYTHPDTAKIASDAWLTGLKEGISNPDSARLFLLNALIDFLQQRGIKLHFIMLPFHPDFYKAVNVNQPLLFEKYQNLFLKIANQKNSTIFGNFDASPMKIERASFYDMYHCSKEAIKIVGITE